MSDKEDLKVVEEEAMAEWLERGYNIKDFSLGKMLELWREEDEDRNDEEALQDKQELIQNLNLLGPMKEQVIEMAKQFKETLKEEAKNALNTAWRFAEIPPLRNRRLLREHVVNVKQMDAESMKYFFVRQNFKEDFDEAERQDEDSQMGLKKRNNRKAPLLFRAQQNKQEAIQAQKDQVLEEIERKRRERIDRELEEKARKRAEKEKFAQDNRAYRRKMNMHYWKDRYIQAKEYSLALNEELEMRKNDAFNDKVELMKAEIREMEREEVADYEKNFDRNETTSSLGIYDTNFEPGEWNSAIDGDDQPGMDNETIGFSTTRTYKAEHELKRIEFQEAQSKALSLKEKLDQIVQVKQNLTLDRTTINERKDLISLEIKQVNQQHSELADQLAGPPRRDPFEEEKAQFHMLVKKKAFFIDQMTELNQREQNLQKRMQIANDAEKKFQPLLKQAEEKEQILKKQVDAFEKESLELPMIFGRGLQTNQISSSSSTTDNNNNNGPSTNAGGEMIASISKPLPNPRKLMAQVETRSKFELFKAAASPVNEHFRKARNYNVDTWKLSHERQIGEEELERARNRLADVREKFFEQKSKDIRADLVQAIHKFHQGNQKLRKSIVPVKGFVEWWKYRDPTKCQAVLHDETIDGLQLVPALSQGSIRGSSPLPKYCLYRIQIDIRWSYEIDQEDEDMMDADGNRNQSIRIFLGNDFDSLQEVYLRDLSGKNLVTGQVFAEFYGTRLCYRFDFYCNPKLLKLRHVRAQEGRTLPHDQRIVLLANVGKFEERIQDFREEEQRMRLLQKEDHFLSEIVKTMRVQSKFSNQRCASLLEELIQVEQSKAHTWDSKIFHGHEQRFIRTTYLSMLKEEIKKEIAVQIDEDVSQRRYERGESIDFSRYRRSNSDDRNFMGPTVRNGSEGAFTANSLSSQLRLQQSKSEYQARKFETAEPLVIKIKESLGKLCSFKQEILPDLGSLEDKDGEKEDIDDLDLQEISEEEATIVPRDDKEVRAKKREERRRSKLAAKNSSKQKHALIVGLRFEWREGKSKLRVLHRIHSATRRRKQSQVSFDGSANIITSPSYHEEWCSLEEANVIFLSNTYVHALKDRRNLLHESKEQFKAKESELEAFEEKELEMQKEEELSQLVAQREDELLHKQKQKELDSRKKIFQAEAIRVATYNEQIASQLEFQAKRRAKSKRLSSLQLDRAVVQDGEGDEEASSEIPQEEFEQALQQVKQEFVQQFVKGRLALVNKTWERKESRVQEKREDDRKGRRMRLFDAKLELLAEVGQTDQKLAKLKQDQEELIQKQSQIAGGNSSTKLEISNFHLALPPKAPCEHVEVKAWGDKYGKGYKCRQCGKEMSNSDQDLTQTKGFDPQLDDDIQADRMGMLRFKNGGHFELIEKERIRLEKEARLMEIQEIYMYDHQAPKVIEEFNYRHFLNRSKRKQMTEKESWPLMDPSTKLISTNGMPLESDHPRTIRDLHEASYREEILFFGRMKNFRFRIVQLAQKHVQLMTCLSIEKDFLKKCQQENENVLARLPMVEQDHSIASRLIQEDRRAQRKLDQARNELQNAIKERQKALHALEGVDEEAEFAEFHAPALKKSCQTMHQVYDQMKQRTFFLQDQIKHAMETLDQLYLEQEQDLTVRLSKFFFYEQSQLTAADHQKSNNRLIVHHPTFGACRFLFIRHEDEMMILEPLKWKARLFVSFDSILCMEKAKEQSEKELMTLEDRQGHFFYETERKREKKEVEQMSIADVDIQCIVQWRQQKEKEEKQVQNEICQQEFQVQMDLEIQKKQIQQKAMEEAKQIGIFSRVSLQKTGQKTRQKRQKHPIFQKQSAAAAKQQPQAPPRSRTSLMLMDPKAAEEATKALDSKAIQEPSNSTGGKSSSVGKLDLMRITRAAQKRLMMFQVEQKLLDHEKKLREKILKRRNRKNTHQRSLQIYHELIQDLLTTDIVQQTIQANVQASLDFQLTNVVSLEQCKQMDKLLAIERLYVSQMKKNAHLFNLWSIQNEKKEAIQKELTRRHLIAEQIFQERQLCEQRRREMLLEEKQMRVFLRQEMIHLMCERRQMQQEENETKEYLRQFELQQMQAKYAKMMFGKKKKNDNAERRLEIKKTKMEKHRLAREWIQIKQEDVLSMIIREHFLKQQRQLQNQIQLEKFLAYKKIMEQGLEDDDEDEEEKKNQRLRIQKQLIKFQKKKEKDQHLFGKFQFQVNFFAKYYKNRLLFSQSLQKYTKQKMEFNMLDTNITKMTKTFEKIQIKTQKVVEDAIFKRQKAIDCHQRVEKTEQEFKEKFCQEKMVLAERKAIYAKTDTMDSSVLHNRPQRFKTEYLHIQLHIKYFELLVENIIRMSIVQAHENKISKLEKEIEINDLEKQQKIQLLEKIGKKHIRFFRMRLKRSQLGALCFGKTQKRILKFFCTQWIQFYSQRVIVRTNFQLRQETIRQNQRIIQLEKDDAISKASLFVESTKEQMTKLSILHTQHQQKIQCRLCKSIYTQAQNHRLACAYHPGAYEVACIRSCRTRQGGPIEGSCMLHRTKRWLCCDATEEGRYGKNGCKQRFHLAIREDPVLEKMVEKKQQEDDEIKNRYQQKIDEIQTRNLVGQKHQQIKSVVRDIEKELEEKRKLVALYEKLDLRK